MWFSRLNLTKSLACLGLCCGLWVAVTTGSAPGQRPGRAGDLAEDTAVVVKELHRSSQPRHLRPADDRQLDACQESDRNGDKGQGKPSGSRHDGEGRRPGARHGGVPVHIERRFIYDAVRRTGGPLELMPLLFLPQVRAELKLDEQVIKPKLDAYMAELEQRLDKHREKVEQQRHKTDGAPRLELATLFNEHVEQENQHFQKFLDQFTESQKDQLIYRFVQGRNYRSLSNQLVQNKMGMRGNDGPDIRKEIEHIREQTMDETRDRFRRIFDKGGGREEFEKMVRENQRKMDARIEKKLTEAQRAQFDELRSKTEADPPEWLIQGLDFPVRPASPGRAASPEKTKH